MGGVMKRSFMTDSPKWKEILKNKIFNTLTIVKAFSSLKALYGTVPIDGNG
jgi:hypothetical protein